MDINYCIIARNIILLIYDNIRLKLSFRIINSIISIVYLINGRQTIHLFSADLLKLIKDCIRILLAANAEIDALNKYGQTPLMMSVGEDHKDCARILLEHGADETIKTQKGKIALDLCKSKKMKMILVRERF